MILEHLLEGATWSDQNTYGWSQIRISKGPRRIGKIAPVLHAPNLCAARSFALAASASRFLGGAFVSSERRRRFEIAATSSTAVKNNFSLPFDGLLNPLIFLTNWSEAARISSSVTGGSKLKRVLIFLHIGYRPRWLPLPRSWLSIFSRGLCLSSRPGERGASRSGEPRPSESLALSGAERGAEGSPRSDASENGRKRKSPSASLRVSAHAC
jgi:hypothetical protein